MDYYEELGIERSATKEDISQAHRRLTKLLHPDQQTDEAIKVLADKQMRRLNSIVEVLDDPERRFRYDQHLQFLSATKNPRPTEGQFRPVLVPRQRLEWMPSRKSILLSLSSAAVGAILMMCALLLWTNDWGGNTYDERRQLAAEAEGNPASNPAQPSLSASAEHPNFDRPSALSPPPSSHIQLGNPSSDGSATLKPTDTKPLVARNSVPHQPPAQTTPLPPPAMQPAPAQKTVTTPKTENKPPAGAAPVSTDSKRPDALAKNSSSSAAKAAPNLSAVAAVHQPKNVLEGYWVYNPPRRENSDPGYYVPEFIHLKLSPKGDGLAGNYEARYMGVPKSISSTVSFSLSTTDRQYQRFIWQGASGSRGTFRVSLLDPDKLRIDWRTTVAGPQQGLTSGVATLVRQNP